MYVDVVQENMRRTLSSFVAVLCLLTLFISSAACLALPQNTTLTTGTPDQHVASAPGHACCPQRSPANQHTSTTCCTVHHQPVFAVSAVELEQPSLIPQAFSDVLFPNDATVDPSVASRIDRAPQPPLIALRI